MKKQSETYITRTESLTDELLQKVFKIALSEAKFHHIPDKAKTAEDYASLATLRFWKYGLKRYDTKKPLEGYVKRIVKNVVKTEYELWKKKKENSEGLGFLLFSLTEGTTDVIDEYSEDGISVEKLLACLPERQQKVVEHSFGVGKTSRKIKDNEIARRLGVTRQTVSSDRKKAIETMKNKLNEGTVRKLTV